MGLSHNEALVYLAALSLGPTTVLKIAEASDLERTNIYRVVKLLLKNGLMSVDVKGLKKMYVAENPSQLETVLELKKKDFNEVLPGLKEQYKKTGESGASEIKYYRGIKAIKLVYEGLFAKIGPKDFYNVISDLERWYKLDVDYFESFIQRRVKKGIQIQFLAQDNARAHYNKKYEKNFLQQVKILPKRTLLETDTIITPQQVVIIQFSEPVTTFVIENKGLIRAHKQYFDIMWKSLSS